MQAEAPDKTTIRQARIAASLTQAQAAELVHATGRTWRYWENGRYPMPLAMWELFELKLAARAAVKG